MFNRKKSKFKVIDIKDINGESGTYTKVTMDDCWFIVGQSYGAGCFMISAPLFWSDGVELTSSEKLDLEKAIQRYRAFKVIEKVEGK